MLSFFDCRLVFFGVVGILEFSAILTDDCSLYLNFLASLSFVILVEKLIVMVPHFSFFYLFAFMDLFINFIL